MGRGRKRPKGKGVEEQKREKGISCDVREERRSKKRGEKAMKLNLFYFTCLNPLRSSELEAVPCMEACTMDFARDLELPGLPTRKRGIRSSMQIAIMKTFSLRAAFLAMFGPRVILSSSTSWQLLRKDG